MVASWSGSRVGPTEYKVAARVCAPDGGLPSVRLRVHLRNSSQVVVAEAPRRRTPAPSDPAVPSYFVT